MAESKETRRPLNGAMVANYRTKLFANGIWKKLLVKFVLITYLKLKDVARYHHRIWPLSALNKYIGSHCSTRSRI